MVEQGETGSRQSAPGDRTKEALFESLYDTLRDMAARQMKSERPSHTLQPTALVHELWIHLLREKQTSWKDESHFQAIATQLMSRLLQEHARGRNAQKRGGKWDQVTLDDEIAQAPERSDEVDAFCDALEELRQCDPELEKVAHYTAFGMTQTEISSMLGVSERKVRKDLAWARSWLRNRMEASE